MGAARIIGRVEEFSTVFAPRALARAFSAETEDRVFQKDLTPEDPIFESRGVP